MPLYAWLGGLLFKLVGPSFLPLRLLSLAATGTTAGLIYWIARRESGLGWLGIVCAGLFLGGYRITGFWYELARVDALFVALSLGGLALGVYGAHSPWRLLLSGLVLSLAFLTKQTAIIFGVGLGVYLVFTAGRRAWLFWLVLGLLTILPVIGLNVQAEGWFWYYTVHIAGINPIESGRILNFIGREWLGLMAGLSVMAFAAAYLGWRRIGWRIGLGQPWLPLMGVAIVISGLGRASVGGNLNNLMSAYSLLGLAPAILAREWMDQSERGEDWRVGLMTVLIVIQFGLGVYNPLRYIPDSAMRQSGARLIGKIAASEGEVLVMMHPYYAWLAGKRPSAQIAALWHARERGAQSLPPDLVDRLKNRYYTFIISDNSLFETEADLQQLLTRYYWPVETLSPTEAPPTTTGMVVQPMVVYMAKP
jgi:4-amino-4-deoxy-L-arabinose transferase-like glycosyltransferase